ncbi:MAG: class I SAM-dependent methyltransferase [Gammaproteobacteria bacterium]|nr:class I SAM-dependent methyltransferase [Gammaproteobacteria bacterium]
MQLRDVTRNYDGAARYYDRLTDIVFGRILKLEAYRGYAIDLLGDLDGATVLDVGCGTGRNFPLLIERIGERGKIIGVDYSEGMLEQARRRIRAEGWSNVELIHGDAARLDGVPGPVDAAIAIWCLGIVYDLEAALNRTVDLIRPGGSLSIMDFGKSRPDRGLLWWLFPLYGIALRRAGIDSAEDLDNAKLEAKWDRGKDVLRARLGTLNEEHYLHGAGVIIAGRANKMMYDPVRAFLVMIKGVDPTPNE